MTSYQLGQLVGELFFCLLLGLLFFYYIRNLVGLLENISPQNRKINPKSVWLLSLGCLKVFFNVTDIRKYLPYELMNIINYSFMMFLLVFQFYLSIMIANSLKEEYISRGIEVGYKPAFFSGILTGIFYLMLVLLYFSGFVITLPYPVVFNFVLLGAYLITLVVYWVQTHKIKKELKRGPKPGITEDSIFYNIER